ACAERASARRSAAPEDPVPEPVEGPGDPDAGAPSGPPPAAPPAQARSALADLEQPALRHPAGTDDDTTGTLREATAPAPAVTKDDGARSSWRRTVLFLAGMLLAGAVVGAAFTFLPRDTPDDNPTSPPPQPT